MLSALCDEILMGSMQLESAAIVRTGKEIRVMAKAQTFRVGACVDAADMPACYL